MEQVMVLVAQELTLVRKRQVLRGSGSENNQDGGYNRAAND